MNGPNTLPAIPDPEGGAHTVEPFAAGGYLTAETESSLSLAPLSEAQRALLERQTKNNKGDYAAIASGTAVEAAGALAHLPPAAGLAMVATGAAVVFGVTFGRPIQQIRMRHHQAREMKAAFAAEDSVSLPRKWIGADVSDELLDAEIEYPTGGGLARTAARALLESVGTTAPGLREHEDARSGKSYWQVSPGQLVVQAIEILGEDNRDRYLRTTYGSLIEMHDASKLLPPQGLMPRTPGSVREHYEVPARGLLYGALGAYAVLREMAGPMVAERVREHYAKHAGSNEALLEDIVHLDQPSKYAVSWATIEDFRDSVP